MKQFTRVCFCSLSRRMTASARMAENTTRGTIVIRMALTQSVPIGSTTAIAASGGDDLACRYHVA